MDRRDWHIDGCRAAKHSIGGVCPLEIAYATVGLSRRAPRGSRSGDYLT